MSAIVRLIVVIRHRLTGWLPPNNQDYSWFYEGCAAAGAASEANADGPAAVPADGRYESEEDYERRMQEEADAQDEADRLRYEEYESDEDYDRRRREEEEAEEADLRELEFLASEDAPDDRWRYDHKGNHPL